MNIYLFNVVGKSEIYDGVNVIIGCTNIPKNELYVQFDDKGMSLSKDGDIIKRINWSGYNIFLKNFAISHEYNKCLQYASLYRQDIKINLKCNVKGLKLLNKELYNITQDVTKGIIVTGMLKYMKVQVIDKKDALANITLFLLDEYKHKVIQTMNCLNDKENVVDNFMKAIKPLYQDKKINY